MDRGRVLILIPHEQPRSSRIKVVNGNFSFVVRVEEDSTPVDIRWLDRFMGLGSSSSGADGNSVLEKGNFDSSSKFKTCRLSSYIVDMMKIFWEKKWTVDSSSRMTYEQRKGSNQS